MSALQWHETQTGWWVTRFSYQQACEPRKIKYSFASCEMPEYWNKITIHNARLSLAVVYFWAPHEPQWACVPCVGQPWQCTVKSSLNIMP